MEMETLIWYICTRNVENYMMLVTGIKEDVFSRHNWYTVREFGNAIVHLHDMQAWKMSVPFETCQERMLANLQNSGFCFQGKSECVCVCVCLDIWTWVMRVCLCIHKNHSVPACYHPSPQVEVCRTIIEIITELLAAVDGALQVQQVGSQSTWK